MYSYIKGTLEEVEATHIVVDNHGIGYQIDVPASVIGRLPQLGEEVKIYTYLHVKEDCFSLFGFQNREELRLFKMMLNVSGIGPKGALGILSALSPTDLCIAVSGDNAKAIAKAPGIGIKTAQKLIIELKDKVDLASILPQEEMEIADTGASAPEKALLKEAQEALVSLGYSAGEAADVLKDIVVEDTMSVEDILKIALKNMAFL